MNNPVFETILLVVIALAVLLVVCWAFGCFKKAPKAEEQPDPEALKTPQETPEQVYTEGEKFYPADDIPSTTVSGRTYSYTKLNTWISINGVEYYQLIESNSGSRFFINKNGKRVYLSSLKVKSFIIKSM